MSLLLIDSLGTLLLPAKDAISVKCHILSLTLPTQARDTLLSYILEQGSTSSKAPVYSAELGVAIEPLKMDMTLDELWSVL